MSETRERLQKMLDATTHTLEVIWHAADHGRDAGHGPASECETCGEFFGKWGEDADPWKVVRKLPLENVWEEAEPHTIVFTTNGPYVEIRGSRRDGGYALYGYWGDEEIRVPASGAVERTAEWLREWS